eukprot:CAMPEP_0116018738 /NCGR_PEP_ID=MMETSP0321-20121206/8822_1 /TAXON_ID=163516 /ORGANISM="Leptocylindrus danicus var. danicus, Strain B650" /LENGTH=69 /DNA_ID=CAMNT_0003489179 /DNA_START=44 /DNA_END=253 /DNA_ORIENTATION=-
MSESSAKKIEEEVDALKNELSIRKEAKTTREACKDILEGIQKIDEPFTTAFGEPNEFHSNPKKGGCVIC